MKRNVRMNERELNRIISESVKRVLNESNGFGLEDEIVNTLTSMRDDINVFLENHGGCSRGDYQTNMESDEFEYQRCLGALTQAFDEFKDLCPDDWCQY